MGNDYIALADFAAYSPSGGAPAAFMMARMQDEKDELKGYVAFQIPLAGINEIMLHRNGMGKTGESYLVGQDGLIGNSLDDNAFKEFRLHVRLKTIFRSRAEMNI